MGGTQKLRLVTMAAAVALTATVAVVPMAWGTTPAAPAAATDDDVVSTVAPVLEGKGATARTYSSREAQRVDAQGGDPAVLGYWTPERMAAATSLDDAGDRALVSQMAQKAASTMAAEAATASPAPAGESSEGDIVVTHPVGPADAAPAAPAGKAGGVEALAVRFPITTGKLFIGGVNGDQYCSASALNTRSKRVVITAGHCVHSGRGGDWYNNLVFVPKYNGHSSTPAPYGKFQAHTLHTFRAWIQYGGTTRGWGRDVGFLSTYTNGNGKRVVNAVGGNGLLISESYKFTASIFGYPSNLDNGEVMKACRGGVAKSRSVPHTSKIVGCDFGGGSSGGPWLWKYNGDTRLGYTRGVTSFGPSNNLYIGSPHFDAAVRTLGMAANDA